MSTRTNVRRRAATVVVALAAHPAIALAQSTSASFRVNAVVDSGGGTSSSASHVVTSCIGSEIAGTQSSSSFRIDSGCGATALAVVRPDGPVSGGGQATPVPTLGDVGIGLLVALLAVAAARKLARRA